MGVFSLVYVPLDVKKSLSANLDLIMQCTVAKTAVIAQSHFVVPSNFLTHIQKVMLKFMQG